METPTIHINGTSAEMLIADHLDALHALQTALEAVQRAAPHPRDYYVQPDPDAFKRARDEHQARLQRLEAIIDDLTKIAMAVEEQRVRRKASRQVL